jgi:hypothetical protein
VRLGESLDLLFSFRTVDPVTWPAAFQVRCKNKTELSLSQASCDVFAKYFQVSILDKLKFDDHAFYQLHHVIEMFHYRSCLLTTLPVSIAVPKPKPKN